MNVYDWFQQLVDDHVGGHLQLPTTNLRQSRAMNNNSCGVSKVSPVRFVARITHTHGTQIDSATRCPDALADCATWFLCIHVERWF